jgi:hypothetical protein
LLSDLRCVRRAGDDANLRIPVKNENDFTDMTQAVIHQ